ncbi:agmatine deiminase family protein [Kocuria sp.]|uniref:agmatine deiminase family protein n=1 Tax=Kocuria sp. TaxID=1871328 RepID=UPI0026DC5E0C|nr:agmatine deiminase family protein [Kocuria sp.]MDO4918058.1 agmatine deiminase family protein [Kocuria sp.]
MKKRLVAEWEPALGAFVTWPAALPAALLRDLALDEHLWVLVTDAASEGDAAAWFASQGVAPDRVTFVRAPQGDDAVWVRDWGPHPVVDETGQLWCVGARYVYATPFSGPEPGDPLLTVDGEPLAQLAYEPVDQRAQPVLARALGRPFARLPHAFTGGNVLSDGHDLLISTEILVAENEFAGATRTEVLEDVTAVTGMSQQVVLPNYEDHGIQHADCFLKVLDEERLLVLRPPSGHPLRERYDGIVREHLEPLLTRYGRPFEILRLDTGVSPHGGLAPYVNSVILNETVYVPQYGIPEDTTALEQWRLAMPGYTVRGYTFEFADEPHAVHNPRNTGPTGWRDGDVLHCRVRGVFDPRMVQLSVRRPGPENSALVRVHAAGAGGTRVVSVTLLSRTSQGAAVTRTSMPATALAGEHAAELPPSAGAVEYAVEVTTEDGRVQRWPRPADAWLRATPRA